MYWNNVHSYIIIVDLKIAWQNEFAGVKIVAKQELTISRGIDTIICIKLKLLLFIQFSPLI